MNSVEEITRKINTRLSEEWSEHRASAQLSILRFIDRHMEQLVHAFRSDLESVTIRVLDDTLTVHLENRLEMMTKELKKIKEQLHSMIKNGQLQWVKETDIWFLKIDFATTLPTLERSYSVGIEQGRIVYDDNGNAMMLC